MSEKVPPDATTLPPVRIDLAEGLTEFPREVFEHAETLEVLNLTDNRLSSLPDDLGRLKKLRILFCSNNEFTSLPAVLGTCPSLTMVGFRANRIARIEDGALPPHLRWLILTENELGELPSALGKRPTLQKLMLSGNRLSDLPEEMAACENLELLRLAANQFDSLPEWFLTLPRLAWLALAGNPINSRCHPAEPDPLSGICWNELELRQKLGEGASGVIHRAQWSGGETPRPVAVKIFKNAMTSDGLPASEMAASLAVGSHPHLSTILGNIANHPHGAEGLVMELIDPAYRNLAAPPSFTSCTRDVYADGQQISLPAVMKIAQGIASAAERLHSRGILHGDLYAHNIMTQTDGRCLLSDFGAAAFYRRDDSRSSARLERVEVRAFGYLLEELLALVPDGVSGDALFLALRHLRDECLRFRVDDRPSFAEVLTRLESLTA